MSAIVCCCCRLYFSLLGIVSLAASDMKPVLCAGLVCLDQVTVVTSFPREDTDMRSLDQYKVNSVKLVTVQSHYQAPTPINI